MQIVHANMQVVHAALEVSRCTEEPQKPRGLFGRQPFRDVPQTVRDMLETVVKLPVAEAGQGSLVDGNRVHLPSVVLAGILHVLTVDIRFTGSRQLRSSGRCQLRIPCQ